MTASFPDLENTTHQAAVATHKEIECHANVETLATLQKRIQKLEQLCPTHSHNPHENESRQTGIHSPKVDAALSIKTSGPRYHSQNYKKSLLHHFRAAGNFILSGFDDPARAPVMNELRVYHEKFTKSRRKASKAKLTSCTLSEIVDLLPSRAACDEAITSYFRNFEKNMRILHYPSFMDECERFWGSMETQHQGFESFVPQLAVTVAIIQAWEDPPSLGDATNVKADILCCHVEGWLDSLPGRQQLTMSTLCTRALLILAQQVRVVPADEIWNATGKLMRSAMRAGLHRDPAEFPEIDIFEGELRRRLWTTIVEMDLEASLTYGMPIILQESNFTCSPAANVDDDDLFDGMITLPVSKPLEESTDSIFQVALAKSLPLRLEAIRASTNRLENLQAHIQSLERYIQDLPPHLQPDQRTKKDIGQKFGTVILHVYLRRVLSHLYRSSTPIGLNNEGPTPGLQSSLSILSYQQFFDPEAFGPANEEDAKCWHLFHIVFKSDIMQATLDVCLHLQTQNLVSWTKASLLLAIDDTIANLTRRISKSGSDIKDVVRLAVISQLLKAQFSKENGEEMMHKGACEVLMACQRAAVKEKDFDGEEKDKEDVQKSHSHSTQLALENETTSSEWAIMPHEPAIADANLDSYFDANGANFDLFSDYNFENAHGDLWNLQ
ncbi:hypothetical protein G7Y89_g9771 [Cudoniella acicularis]|uniref:Xylanolytic transcriptional activator regulatory domain-containing protein n=1 Tax=Cudoniella acicularis TaxID=354080 RepID=A0A8H4VZP5_9HELO|nr:hypothetical protein G7Y89_g9771 [Cudoniella acicularis]